MKKIKEVEEKMRVSFDLDEVLFVSPDTHATEAPLPFPLNKIFKERLRKGTIHLVHTLQENGLEVWVYTSSFRSEFYIRTLFFFYGIRFDSIVNGTRHLKEVQRDNRMLYPQKMPCRYRISLHIDDEAIIMTSGKQYGFEVFLLEAQDDEWEEKILDRLEAIKRRNEYRKKQGENVEDNPLVVDEENA